APSAPVAPIDAGVDAPTDGGPAGLPGTVIPDASAGSTSPSSGGQGNPEGPTPGPAGPTPSEPADGAAPPPGPTPEGVGGRTGGGDGPDSGSRKTARVLLWPLRATWAVAWWVPRQAMYLYDRYQLTERLKSIFFNETGTVGVFPVAFIETGFGLNVGA